MKKITAFLLLGAVALLSGAEPGNFEHAIRVLAENPPARKCVLDAKKSIPLSIKGKPCVEIIVPPGAPSVVRVAAEELQYFLSASLGGKVPVLRKPGKALTKIHLGDSAGLRKLGVDAAKLFTEGFVIRTSGNDIFIAGRDMKQNFGQGWGDGDRGTLFGIYGFLEKFLGCRFYFPGEIGTIIPKHADFSLPGIDIFDRPDYPRRNIYPGPPAKWFPENDGKENRRRHYMRMRLQSFYIPVCHSLERLQYPERFAKTRPDFFALAPTGKRYLDPGSNVYGNLCFTNPDFRNELYKDAVAYLTGQPPKSRGLTRWDHSIARKGFFNIMPKDLFRDCCCANCKKFERADLVWDLICDIANRLKKNNIPGYVTALAYAHYCNVPNREIPDNVLVMVSAQGPWGDKNPPARKAHDARIAAWYKKTGHKPWTWSAVYKYGGLQLPNVPPSTPRAIINYFSRHKNDLSGSFMESETDHWILSFLNYYAFSKVAWNNDTNADQLLNEFYSLMFGKGAKPMAGFFESMEDIWINKVAGRIVETPLGSNAVPPSDYEVWEKLYSPAQLKKMEQFIAQALKLAGNDTMAVKRIRYFERYLLGQIKTGADKYFATRAAVDDWRYTVLSLPGAPDEKAWAKAPVSYMIPWKPADTSEVHSSFKVLRDSKNLYFRVICGENDLKSMITDRSGRDNPDLWQDSVVEFFLNGSGDRKVYNHFIINSKGEIYDSKITKLGAKGVTDLKWNSKAVAKTVIGKDFWQLDFTVPLADLGRIDPKKFVANVGRFRVLKHKSEIFSWSPYIKNFHDLENFGIFVFADQLPKDENLVKNGDFTAPVKGRSFGGVWYTSQQDFKQNISLDTTTYRVGGKSLKITAADGQRARGVTFFFNPPLKPDTTYKLTWQIKLDKVTQQGKTSGAAVNIASPGNMFYPRNWYCGTMPWTRQGWIFTTPKENKKKLSYLRLYLFRAAGTVWFDDIKLVEVKK